MLGRYCGQALPNQWRNFHRLVAAHVALMSHGANKGTFVQTCNMRDMKRPAGAARKCEKCR